MTDATRQERERSLEELRYFAEIYGVIHGKSQVLNAANLLRDCVPVPRDEWERLRERAERAEASRDQWVDVAREAEDRAERGEVALQKIAAHHYRHGQLFSDLSGAEACSIAREAIAAHEFARKQRFRR